MIRRRRIEVFSLSFLDCLCCGFGAILLLFILSIGSGEAGVESPVDARTLERMEAQLAGLEAAIAEQSARLEAATEEPAHSRERERILSRVQELESELADLEQEYEARKANLNTGQQEAAEAKRLLESFEYEDLPPVGLPSDATHVAFVIDTSGSMRNQLTRQLHFGVVEQIRELLDALPEVKSMQFLDTSGNYMLAGRSGFWLPDTPGLREQALRNLVNYPVMSASDPERGIRTALADLRPALGGGERMGIYVMGDDFQGSTRGLRVKVDQLNPRDPATGRRSASISAVGFPTMVNPFRIGAAQGNARFANIMRELAEAHEGVLILKPDI